MESNDIRWQQRFENFEKVLTHLETALQIEMPDITQRAGIVQFFELSFELAWKLMKDYLEAQGFTEVSSPRAAIKKAFEQGLISNGHLWLQLLDDRNLVTHTYDEPVAVEVDLLIRIHYYPLLSALHHIFNAKIS